MACHADHEGARHALPHALTTLGWQQDVDWGRPRASTRVRATVSKGSLRGSYWAFGGPPIGLGEAGIKECKQRHPSIEHTIM